MIEAQFFKLKENKIFVGFKIFGHAFFAENGSDIVCSAVSSCVMMTCNAITEILSLKCILEVNENSIYLMLDEFYNEDSNKFIESLYLHLKLLSEQYVENILVTDRGV